MAKDFNTNTDNNETWLTPPSLIKSLGEFDLDPCSPIGRPWDTAKNHMTIDDDGLLMPWDGRVWLNPPYGKEIEYWMQKMTRHMNGTALTFARTETQWFQAYVFPFADSMFFIKGRVRFHYISGIQAKTGGNAPSVLIGYDEFNSDMISDSGLKGHHVSLKPKIFIAGISLDDKRTWRVIVGEALEELNREAGLEDIYAAVIKMAPARVKKNNHFKAKVRQTLQYHYEKIEKATYRLN